VIGYDTAVIGARRLKKASDIEPTTVSKTNAFVEGEQIGINERK